jgi:outer membrane protein assembly factor BamB
VSAGGRQRLALVGSLVTAVAGSLAATAVAGGPGVWVASVVGVPRPDRDAATPVARVGALDADWVAPVTGWPASIAADAAGAVVIAGRGEVRGLEPGGSTTWATLVPGAGLHAPALGQGAVVVSAAGRIVALDRVSGEVQWEAGVASGAGPVRVAGKAERGGAVALGGTESGELLALDLATGALRWAARHPGGLRSPPVVDRGAGVVAATWHGGGMDRVRAFDLATGAPRWDATLAPFAAAPVAQRGLLLVAEGDGEGDARVVARAIETGVVAWSSPVPSSFESGIRPAAAGADVAVVDHFGTVTLLDLRTGAPRWEAHLDLPVLRTEVLLTERAVVLTTHPGDLVALDRASGRVRRARRPGGFPVGLARCGRLLLVALRLAEPGRVEAITLP